ncbi:hypothetical protein MTR67_002109 [Solanum verrucosum]|uniref:Uncharacterized protein n=1 Tax=Solanum verrucosum TaxID=315347 RepID=A0AAF0T8G0_SOLVR|nr:hypothetical protein MTR67_002109 [Solanum verrucosum]
MCCSGSFGVISLNRQSTRQFALWCRSSPSCTSLQHHRALSHWVTWYCCAELLGDAPIALFFRRLDPFFQAQHTGTKGEVRPFRTRQVDSVILRPSFLHSFQPFHSFL